MSTNSNAWPSLDYAAWSDTLATLHLWTQIVGKIRMVRSPWTNHSWHVTLYVTSTGLSTSTISHGARTFQIDFDFVAHRLAVLSNDGRSRVMPLEPQSVAAFYGRLMQVMDESIFTSASTRLRTRSPK